MKRNEVLLETLREALPVLQAAADGDCKVLYVCSKVMHEYSPTDDRHTAHCLLAKVPVDWLKGNPDGS